MGLFDKLLGKGSRDEGLVIYAPMDGEAVSISQVNDPTFSEEILGKGVAVLPSGNQVFAPCDATVEMMFDSATTVPRCSSTWAWRRSTSRAPTTLCTRPTATR